MRRLESGASPQTPIRCHPGKEKLMGILNDHDPVETQEWIDSLRAVMQHAAPSGRGIC